MLGHAKNCIWYSIKPNGILFKGIRDSLLSGRSTPMHLAKLYISGGLWCPWSLIIAFKASPAKSCGGPGSCSLDAKIKNKWSAYDTTLPMSFVLQNPLRNSLCSLADSGCNASHASSIRWDGVNMEMSGGVTWCTLETPDSCRASCRLSWAYFILVVTWDLIEAAVEILNVTLKYTCILHAKCNLKFKRVYPLLHQVLAHAFINTYRHTMYKVFRERHCMIIAFTEKIYTNTVIN